MNSNNEQFFLKEGEMKKISLILILIFLTGSLFCETSSHSELQIYDINSGDFLLEDLTRIEAEAWQYYQKEEFEKAAASYLKLLKNNITDTRNIYNLACCYGLLGEAQLAAHYLAISYQKGFTDIDHISNDPDFLKVKNDPAFTSLLDSLKTQAAEEKTSPDYLVSTTTYQNYKLKLPPDYDPDKNYPLLVGLHGLGDNSENFFKLGENISDFFYAVPQAPYPLSTGTNIGYSWSRQEELNPNSLNESWLKSAQFVVDMIDLIKSRYKISNVYLFGFSQGGHLSYLTGLKYHDKIKAIAPFGAWLPDDILAPEDLQQAAGLEIFIAHGKEDRVVEFSQAERACEVLSDHGFTIEKEYYEGGHQLSRDAINNAFNWFRQMEGIIRRAE